MDDPFSHASPPQGDAAQHLLAEPSFPHRDVLPTSAVDNFENAIAGNRLENFVRSVHRERRNRSASGKVSAALVVTAIGHYPDECEPYDLDGSRSRYRGDPMLINLSGLRIVMERSPISISPARRNSDSTLLT